MDTMSHRHKRQDNHLGFRVPFKEFSSVILEQTIPRDFSWFSLNLLRNVRKQCWSKTGEGFPMTQRAGPRWCHLPSKRKFLYLSCCSFNLTQASRLRYVSDPDDTLTVTHSHMTSGTLLGAELSSNSRVMRRMLAHSWTGVCAALITPPSSSIRKQKKVSRNPRRRFFCLLQHCEIHFQNGPAVLLRLLPLPGRCIIGSVLLQCVCRVVYCVGFALEELAVLRSPPRPWAPTRAPPRSTDAR